MQRNDTNLIGFHLILNYTEFSINETFSYKKFSYHISIANEKKVVIGDL